MNKWLVLGILFFLSCEIFAQKPDKPYLASIGVGASAGITRLFDTMLGTSYQPGIVNQSSIPVIQLAFDQRLNRRVSLGAGFSFQSTAMEIYDSSRIFMLESGNIRTTHVAFRVLWHWGKKEKIDYYAGFKTGLLFQTVGNHESAFNLSDMPDVLTKSRFTTGLVPFGVRWFVNEQFGVNVETSLGVASIITVGANYRWAPKKK